MEKKIDNKKIVAILIPVVVIALIAIIAIFFLKDEEGYRLIQVYEVNGEAIIERQNIGSMDAYENLNLASEDKVTTMLKSHMRLKLDEDKYLLAEEDTILELVATGDEKSSRTNVNLLKGCVTIEIESKLNEDSTFEVTTPNSVMAVRGTVFRVSAGLDENGKPITKVSIFEGAVTVQKVDENGNVSEETLVEESKEAVIYTENEEEVLVLLDEIDTTELPLEVLEFLEEIIEGGRELSIPLEEIKSAIEEVKAEMDQNIDENSSEESTDDSSEESDNGPDDSEHSNQNSNQNTNDDNDDSDDSTNTETDDNDNDDSDNSTNTETDDSDSDDSTNTETDDNDNDDSDNSTNTETDDTDNDDSDDSTNTETDDNDNTTDEEEVVIEKEYTVTFMYNGAVFGTQKVKEGELAAKPTLMPAPSGSWDFDFTKPITQDTTIQFK